MPVLRSAVNGLAIGIISGTRGVIPYYKNGDNNMHVWGSSRAISGAAVDEKPVQIEASVKNTEPAIDPIAQPKVEKVVETIEPTPKRKGRSNKPAALSKAKVVNEDPPETDEEISKREIQAVMEEKGLV